MTTAWPGWSRAAASAPGSSWTAATASAGHRSALSGKVHCRVDAGYAPLEVGDLLTTSATLGHAMKATDPSRAFGAILGKALRPLGAGTALIPILVALR